MNEEVESGSVWWVVSAGDEVVVLGGEDVGEVAVSCTW